MISAPVQRPYIAHEKAYIAKRDTHMAAYSVTRVSRACNDRQKAAIARLARKANVFRGSGGCRPWRKRLVDAEEGLRERWPPSGVPLCQGLMDTYIV